MKNSPIKSVRIFGKQLKKLEKIKDNKKWYKEFKKLSL